MVPQLIEERGSLFRRMVLGHLVPVAVARFSGAALDIAAGRHGDLNRRLRDRLDRIVKHTITLAPERFI